MTPVQAAVAEYLALGWKLCAINPGKKGPLYEGWNTPGNDIKEPHRFPLGWGVGLLHATSGTCAFDIDSYETGHAFMQAREIDLDALWNDPFAIRFGRGDPNRGKLLYAMPTPRVSIAFAPYPSQDKDGKPAKKMALELRCTSSKGNSVQDVLPPSMHPSGKPYEWALGPFAHLGNLPPLPAALEALWDELGRPAASAGPTVAVPSGKAPEAIQRWLKTQDPSMSYDEWLKVGMKLHAEFQGSAEGFGVWQMWSSGSDKWDEKAKQEMYPKWKGFKLEGPAIATLAADVRQMPAAAEEFPVVDTTSPQVAPQVAPLVPQSAAALAGLVAPESAPQVHNRELMQSRLIYLTGAKARWWLRDDHTQPRIEELDSLAGAMDAEAVRMAFQKHMAGEANPKRGGAMEYPDPVEYFKHAKWERSIVRQVGFHPGEQRIYTDPVDNQRYFNSYANNRPAPVPMPPDIEAKFHWLLGRISDKKFGPWLCQFYAHALQKPGVKIEQAPLLFGDPGSGKSTLMDQIPALLFGRRYVKQVTHDILLSRFAAEAMLGAWFVTLNELKMSGDKRIDRSAIAEKLKPIITEPMLSVECKGLGVYEIPNRVQITASSNKDDALHIEDAEGERRWGVAELREKLTEAEIAEYIIPVYADAQGRSAAWFTHYFLTYPMWDAEGRPLNDFRPKGRPPMTQAKIDMAELSEGNWEGRIRECMTEGHQPFDKDIVSAHELKDLLKEYGCPSWSRAGATLRAAPFRAAPNKTDTMRYWAWRNQDVWRTLPPKAWRDYHLHQVVPPEIALLGDTNAPSP